MKLPPHEVIVALATMARTHPSVAEWADEWLRRELSQLPRLADNVAMAQGRCQVLQELSDLLNKAPELAAQPRANTVR